MSEALEGIKVIDLTMFGPGGHCSKILADLGADVIRVAEVGTSGGRRGGRPYAIPVSAYGMRRNTRVIGVNLKSPEGLEVFSKLAANADVLMVGIRPSAAERLGIEYESVQRMNPRIIYCSLTGYGADGPYRDLAGHDINYQSIGGSVGMTGRVDGPPMIVGATAADSAGGGMHAAIAILAAVVARQQTGQGQFLDVAATDGIVNMMSIIIDEYLYGGVEPKRGATFLTGQYPWYNIYQTKDGKYISVGAIEPWFYENLCRLLGLEDLATHQYAEGEKREEAFRRFREAFLTRTRDEWVSLLMTADTCTTPVYSIAELVSDPNLLHRKMIIEVDHPGEGKIKQVGVMFKMSATPGVVKSLAPQMGEFTEEILEGIGYSKTRIAELRDLGVLQ